MSCSNGFQTSNIDNWSISQCGEFKEGTITEITEGFESESQNSKTQFSSLFLNIDSNCATQDCTLLAPGCVDPFTASASDVSIETTPDLALSVSKTNEAGF